MCSQLLRREAKPCKVRSIYQTVNQVYGSHYQWDYIKMLSGKCMSAIDEITFVSGRQVGADQFNLLRSKEETLNIDTLGTAYGLSDSENLR